MLREDNSGFINFPIPGKMINRIEGSKTFVYLVAFDVDDVSNNPYILSNLRLTMPGEFVSDDINMRQRQKNPKSLDELIKNGTKDNEYDKMYFPNNKNSDDKIISIPMTSAICIGWSEFTYEVKDNIGNWSASFRDLTYEGRKLYYSMKKLHNNKEVRILTFNNI